MERLPHSDNSWEPQENVNLALILEFERKMKKKGTEAEMRQEPPNTGANEGLLLLRKGKSMDKKNPMLLELTSHRSRKTFSALRIDKGSGARDFSVFRRPYYLPPLHFQGQPRSLSSVQYEFGGKKIRSRVLEEILDTHDFECKFKDNGCAQLCKRGELTSHANLCTFNPDTVPLCQQFGILEGCGFRLGSVSRAEEIIAHFEI
ncbi:putative E3 ubiquitin-protein ligase SINA-like 6, partial [Orchesella cincta]